MATYSPSKITKDGNTYNFTDTTKIPLTGTNDLRGTIRPNTDDAYNLGSSSYNFKIVYTKEIRHGLSSGSLVLSGGNGTSNGANLVLYGTNRSDGFQGRFDLVAKGSTDYKLTGLPSGTLTWDGDTVDTIEEQGDGYIRYSNGIQICWGYVSAGLATTVNFPKSFSGMPVVSVTCDTASTDSRVTAVCTSQTVTAYCNFGYYGSFYIAIGKWK